MVLLERKGLESERVFKFSEHLNPTTPRETAESLCTPSSFTEKGDLQNDQLRKREFFMKALRLRPSEVAQPLSGLSTLVGDPSLDPL